MFLTFPGVTEICVASRRSVITRRSSVSLSVHGPVIGLTPSLCRYFSPFVLLNGEGFPRLRFRDVVLCSVVSSCFPLPQLTHLHSLLEQSVLFRRHLHFDFLLCALSKHAFTSASLLFTPQEQPTLVTVLTSTFSTLFRFSQSEQEHDLVHCLPARTQGQRDFFPDAEQNIELLFPLEPLPQKHLPLSSSAER